jgi:hypothetical protein
MGAPTSEVGYNSATNRRGTTKSIWTCGGIGEEEEEEEIEYTTPHIHGMIPT